MSCVLKSKEETLNSCTINCCNYLITKMFAETQYEKVKVPITTKDTKKSPYKLEVTGGWFVKTHNKKCICVYNLFLFPLVLIYISAITWTVFNTLREAKHLNYLTSETLKAIINIKDNYLRNVPNNSEVQTTSLYYGYDRRLSRHKRSNNETNVQGNDKKNKRRCPKTIETVAVQFKGFLLEEYAKLPLEDVLGPWSESAIDNRHSELMGIKLIDRRRKLEISRKGLYFIYSQVTYRSGNTSATYSINVISAIDKSDKALTTCSTDGRILNDVEVSCYTSVTRLLIPGDVVYLQQYQLDIEVNFYDSFTFIGLIRLNNV